MFCKNCGKTAEENALFCTGCGTRLSGPDTSTIAAAVTAVIEKPVEPTEIQQPQQPQQAQPEQQVHQTCQEDIPAPIMPEISYTTPLPEKPKTIFGTGARIFCLVIIGLLSISTGIFAGLYLSLIR